VPQRVAIAVETEAVAYLNAAQPGVPHSNKRPVTPLDPPITDVGLPDDGDAA
jgi:hypothetical protein